MNDTPDRFCVTAPNGECVSDDPRCMHYARPIAEVGRTVLGWVKHNLDANAVIAGGWARDLYLDKTPKDIDVWLYLENPDLGAIVQQFMAAASVSGLRGFANVLYKTTLIPEDHGAAHNWCQAILKFTVDGCDVDLIIFAEPVVRAGENVLERFDFGLCQIAYTGWGYSMTPAFLDDVENKTITFQEGARDREDLDRVVDDHLVRMQAKFPDYQPKNIPTVFDKVIGKARSGLRSLRGFGFGGFGY